MSKDFPSLAPGRRPPLAPRARRQAGFTLVELMMVVFVVTILASVAYPTYTNQVRKAQRVEARAALMRASQLLERSFTQQGGYPVAADFSTLFGLAASASVYSNPDRPSSSTNSKFQVTYTPTAAPATGGLPLGYTLSAVPLAGNMSDPSCGTFGLNERGVRSTSGADSDGRCWR